MNIASSTSSFLLANAKIQKPETYHSSLERYYQFSSMMSVDELFHFASTKLIWVLGSLNNKVNCMVQALSNGRYKSVLHRAVTNKDQARTSIACFSHPRLDATITVAPELLDADHPAIYKPFGWLEYREIHIRRGSEYKKTALEFFLADQETQQQQDIITTSN